MSHHHEGCCKHEGQPRHEGCCKGEKSEHEHCGHGHQHEHGQCCGGRHGRGGGRRQRFFGHGELRLVILDILSRDDSHGYELIKAIENLTQGNYTPSPGVIYPTLDFLQEQSLITIREEEGKIIGCPHKLEQCTGNNGRFQHWNDHVPESLHNSASIDLSCFLQFFWYSTKELDQHVYKVGISCQQGRNNNRKIRV